jgi:hypothetical protein
MILYTKIYIYLEANSMMQFKTTTYATLLLIGIFVLPYAWQVEEVTANDLERTATHKKWKSSVLKKQAAEADVKLGERSNNKRRGPAIRGKASGTINGRTLGTTDSHGGRGSTKNQFIDREMDTEDETERERPTPPPPSIPLAPRLP